MRGRIRRLSKKQREQKPWETDYQKLVEQIDFSEALAQERESQVPEIRYPEKLPIAQNRDRIVEAIQNHQVLIIAGETGSGKTTQIPKMCLDAGRGRRAKIGCTQPRRLAATSMARQISKELDSELGVAVGYKIRFAEQISDTTYIQMMTDGMLLQEMQTDRFLNQYDTLIIDEAHERSLNIDFLLGCLKQLLAKRRDLKLIISSANLDIPRFSEAFDTAPVIEVSGRVYPVEEIYQPLDEDLEEQGEKTVVDAMVETIREILETSWDGNVLAFLPGEQEIREVMERLGSNKQKVEVLPLFARLSNQEQNRIFQTSGARKIIVSTNIAETSLTIPGIRYVVDSGLARVSRFSNRTHTQRLPVEPISRSSANQRKGRAGRVQAGVCIRLYSKDSFIQRKEFTDPEILRSSLAGVILRMKALGLGEIEEFPFIDPPTSSAIRGGQKLLKEMGALDEANQLTKLGREMSRLPIEPRTSRMLLEARDEEALREVLAIAAGISVQDPREYPLEKQEQARQMHSRFIDKTSDFVTLLNIWDQYHDEWDRLKSENKMRKFCKSHFLSFVRMREWRDIHHQLSSILKDLRGFTLKNQGASYQAIHMSILAGHLNQIGLKKQKNLYQTGGNREMMIFPGSSVFNKGEAWVVAAELVETSRLFARRVANIEVEWLETIGKNLCRHNYSEPTFDSESGSVIAHEKVTLYGLVIVAKRRVFFGKINPAEATAVFIRSGLVDGELRTNHAFFKHNNALKKKVLKMGSKLRKSYDYEIEAAMQDFYAERLYNIASVHDLNGLIKKKQKDQEKDFLFMSESDLALDNFATPSLESFPDHWTIGDRQLKINYQFSPDQDRDGVSIRIQENLLPFVEPEAIDWLVPGQWEEKIYFLLKALPKVLRKQLVPVSQTAQDIAQALKPTDNHFLQALSRHIQGHYGISVPVEEWSEDQLPDHLKVKVTIQDKKKRTVVEGRNAAELLNAQKESFKKSNQAQDQHAALPQWKQATEKWEIKDVQTWSFESLPKKIEIGASSGLPLLAYPGLKEDEHGIHRLLFRVEDEAKQSTQKAMVKLLAQNMGSDIAWLEKDFKELKGLQAMYKPFGNLVQLKEHCRHNIYQYIFQSPWISDKAAFDKVLAQAQSLLRGLWYQFYKKLEAILEQHRALHDLLNPSFTPVALFQKPGGCQEHLSALLGADFILDIPYERWKHITRYLKGIEVRADRCRQNPSKDEEKSENLVEYEAQWQQLRKNTDLKPEQKEALEEFRWMLEEFRISLFAPELKTAMPISTKRLDKFLDKIKSQLLA